MSKYYLVCIRFTIEDLGESIDQFYVTTQFQMQCLQFLDDESEDGTCCSQNGCIFCKFGPTRIKYVNSFEINDADINDEILYNIKNGNKKTNRMGKKIPNI